MLHEVHFITFADALEVYINKMILIHSLVCEKKEDIHTYEWICLKFSVYRSSRILSKISFMISLRKPSFNGQFDPSYCFLGVRFLYKANSNKFQFRIHSVGNQ